MSKWKKAIVAALIAVIVGAVAMFGYTVYETYFKKPPVTPFVQSIIDNVNLYFPGLHTVPFEPREWDLGITPRYKYLQDRSKGLVARRSGFLYPIPLNPNYEIKTIDFASWKAKNNEVIGYLEFENLPVVSYPVLYKEGSDFYLKHDIGGGSDIFGEIYVEGMIKGGHSRTNTIIYGHNMKNGTMFGSLRKYKDASYFPGNEFFWYYTPTGKYRYQIFTVYETLYTSDTFTWYETPGPEYTAYLKKMKSQSKYETGVTPADDDEIITLVTCTSAGGDYRLILQGRLIYKDELPTETAAPVPTATPVPAGAPVPQTGTAAPGTTPAPQTGTTAPGTTPVPQAGTTVPAVP